MRSLLKTIALAFLAGAVGMVAIGWLCVLAKLAGL